MKNIFDIMLILIVTISMFICMMFFAEEVVIVQDTVHLKSRVVEILEINGGYTEEAQIKVNELIDYTNRNVSISFSKEGKLSYGEKVDFIISVSYTRTLPFIPNEDVVYEISGSYYNIKI